MNIINSQGQYEQVEVGQTTVFDDADMNNHTDITEQKEFSKDTQHEGLILVDNKTTPDNDS